MATTQAKKAKQPNKLQLQERISYFYRVIPHVTCHYGVCTCIADVYSYDEDDMVEDPKLAEHLAHFGIDVMKMQKVGSQSLIKE